MEAIDLISATAKSLKENSNLTINGSSKIDKHAIKQQLGKLCQKSNEIVECQRRLDKLNLALKQLNQLQTIRMLNASNLVEIRKSLVRTSGNNAGGSRCELFVQVEFENKSLQLETDTHYLLVCVKLEKLAGYSSNTSASYDSYWSSRFDKLRGSSNATMRINITTDYFERHFYPAFLKVYLIYDVNSLIDTSAQDEYSSAAMKSHSSCLKNNEFTVCLYACQFQLDEFFFLSADSRFRPECLLSTLPPPLQGTNLLWSVFSEFYKRYKNNSQRRVDDIWTCLSVVEDLQRLASFLSPKVLNTINGRYLNGFFNKKKIIL